MKDKKNWNAKVLVFVEFEEEWKKGCRKLVTVESILYRAIGEEYKIKKKERWIIGEWYKFYEYNEKYIVNSE